MTRSHLCHQNSIPLGYKDVRSVFEMSKWSLCYTFSIRIVITAPKTSCAKSNRCALDNIMATSFIVNLHKSFDVVAILLDYIGTIVEFIRTHVGPAWFLEYSRDMISWSMRVSQCNIYAARLPNYISLLNPYVLRITLSPETCKLCILSHRKNLISQQDSTEQSRYFKYLNPTSSGK
jgi:hypothetical protein